MPTMRSTSGARWPPASSTTTASSSTPTTSRTGSAGTATSTAAPTDADGSEGEPNFGPYQAVGHQAIVDAIRSTGATQPIIVSGIDFAGDVSRWRDFMPNDPRNSLIVGWNSFDYSGNLAHEKPFLRSLSHGFPILVGGFGDTDCNSNYSLKLMKFFDRLGGSYLAWTWNTEADYGGCANALLGPKESAYYSAHPSGFGKGVRKHFLKVQRKHRRHHR